MAPPFYRLYTPPGSLFAFAPLIVSEYSGVHIEVEKSEGIEQIIASKSPTGKSPILETQQGQVIFSSQAICRFIAALRRDTGLLGSKLRETAAIDDWLNWASQELELPACVCYYVATGLGLGLGLNEKSYTKAKEDIASSLGLLESHLQKGSSSNNKLVQTYLVNPEHITLADIVVACILVYPFTLVFDEAYLKSYPTVMRWFLNCTQQPEFVAVLGKIECGRSKH